MKKKMITFSLIAWTIAAISSPAQALVAIPKLEKMTANEITEVTVTGKPIVTSPVTGAFQSCESGGNYGFNYLQLMAIPGAGTVLAYSETTYTVGLKPADLVDMCVDEDNNTFYIYVLGSCDC